MNRSRTGQKALGDWLTISAPEGGAVGVPNG